MARETHYALDAETQLSDETSAITSAAAAQVGGSAQIIDLGAATIIAGDMVVDVSAMDIASGDEVYKFRLQGSSSATFASTIQDIALLSMGDGSTIASGVDVDDTTGRYIVPFRNERNGTSYRYLRLFRAMSGTSTSITSKAWITKRKAV